MILYQFLGLAVAWGLGLSPSAQAYIPDYQMIMSRTAENHGRGLYQIEQDVIFRSDPDPLVVHEVWWILSEHTMKVSFDGRGQLKGLIQGTMIYDTQQRYWRDEGGSVKNTRVSEDWVEPFFHFRFSKNIKPRLVAMKIAPPESMKERTVQTRTSGTLEFTYPDQSFLRLSRTGGGVSYAIGRPSPVEGSSEPGLWIAQDQFVVQKIRLPSQVLVQSDQITHYPENLWLPKVRTFSWGAHSAQVVVTSVRSVSKKSSRLGDIFKPSAIDVQKNPQARVRWPEQEAVREFYQRFR